MQRCADLGPIVEMHAFAQKFLLIAGAELSAQLCDETRFHRALPPPVTALRDFAGDGSAPIVPTGEFRGRAPHSNRPFGTGERACIGRQFALHEAVLVLARLLHRYDITGDPDHELAISARLTLMPKGSRTTLARRTPATSPPTGATQGAGRHQTSPANPIVNVVGTP
jgi:cytochrome P450